MKKYTALTSLILSIGLFLPSVQAFDDVPENSWFGPAVLELENMGIIDSSEAFYPERESNRAEVVKMIIEAINGLEGHTIHGISAFDDVKTTDWFYPYVDAAASRGIVSGYADANGSYTGYFGPADALTRAAAVKILIEAFELKSPILVPAEFSDVQLEDWFYTYVKNAQSLGIVQGYADGSFDPHKAVTRAEFAKMLSASLNSKYPKEVPDLGPAQDPETEAPADEEEVVDEGEDEMVVKAQPNPVTLSSDLISEGSERLVSRYDFKGVFESFTIQTVTVANDPTGDDIGDDPVGTPTLKTVTIKYPDKDGVLKMHEGALKGDGTVRFSGLDFHVERNEESFFEIYATMNDFSDFGESYSGEMIRLGLPTVNNTTDIFKAIGNDSSEVVTFGDGATLTANANPENFTIRKTSLSFDTENTSGFLSTGTNDLLKFEITADASGSASLGRMVMDISVEDNDGVNLSVDGFKLYDGPNVINDVVIYDATGAQDLTPGGGALTDGVHKVIVSFDNQEVISAGVTKNYRLKADVSGAASDDSIVTGLASDDSALTGLTDLNHPNTGKIFVNGDATAGLFTVASDFSQNVGTDLNLVWSDRSFSNHLYPTVAGGTVTTNTGTADWTNGYLLGLSSFSDNVLSR